MNGIQQNSQEARSQRLLSRLCFSGRSEEQDGRPGLWLAEAFSISPLKPLNGIQQKLTGRNISTSSNKFVFFGSIGGTRWPTCLWFAETFQLLLRDRWTRFNETWQEARSQRPLLIYVIRADKKRPPWPLIGWDIFDFSSVTAEQNSTKLDRKQNFNVLYQVRVIRRNLTGSKIHVSMSSTKFVFFGSIGKTRWPSGLWFAETFLELQEIRYVNPIFQVKIVFFRPIGNTLYSGLRYMTIGPLVYVFSRNENFWNVWILVELMILSHVITIHGDFAATYAIVMNDDCGEV